MCDICVIYLLYICYILVSAHTHQTRKPGQMKLLKQLKHVDKDPENWRKLLFYSD